FGVRELAEVAQGAGYWGGFPAGADPLDDPVLRPAIRAMAARLARAEGCGWWWSGIDRSAQEYVQWAARDEPAPVLGRAADTLRNVGLKDDERKASMNKYLRLPVGRLGALLLAGQEDGFDDAEAVVWPLAVADTARIFEVDSPGAWQELVSGDPRPAMERRRRTARYTRPTAEDWSPSPRPLTAGQPAASEWPRQPVALP
ncbi:MAG TPA: hypothetical protein VF940_15625, partial [Streptosporangiaceae bacterium]